MDKHTSEHGFAVGAFAALSLIEAMDVIPPEVKEAIGVLLDQAPGSVVIKGAMLTMHSLDKARGEA